MNMELWDKLSSNEKQKFAQVINILLTNTFVLEKKYNNYENKTVINDNYRFIEYNATLVRQFLDMMGWALIEDDFNGVYLVRNEEFNNYIKLSKMGTIFLIVLRLIYEEKQETVSSNREIIVKLSDILNKIEVFKLLNKIPSQTERKEALVKLKRYQIIDKLKGDYESPDSMYIIYPSIIHCINEKNVQDIINEFTNADIEESDKNMDEFLDSQEVLEDEIN